MWNLEEDWTFESMRCLERDAIVQEAEVKVLNEEVGLSALIVTFHGY